MGIRETLSLLIFLVFIISSANSDQRNTLLTFRSSLSNTAALSNWNANTNICQGNISIWKGVICVDDALFGLRLENMSLGGNIDVDSLSQVQGLKTLSLNNNSFTGYIPPVYRIGGLRGIFLSYNNFSGEIPDGFFSGMNSLRKVDLDHNGFVGRIPKSLAGLSKVREVKLNDNQFQGRIPDFKNRDGISLNFTNNNLEGPIPKSMKSMDPSLFAGNPGLCGKPLQTKCKKKSITKLLLIVLFVVLAVASIAALTMAFLIFRKRRRSYSAEPTKLGKKEIKGVNCCYKGSSRGAVQDHSPDTYKKAHQNGKLQFVRNDSDNFELGELLSASAEVLGSGSFGSSYKATLFNGRTVVVKRFRQMKNNGKEDFNQHMKRLGRISHPNLLPLIAFYYRKEEKLLVSDFALNGSLASHLHGNSRGKQSGLDWPMRLKIIKGVARGLVHLHKELPNQTLPHGHLKSSNVLLTSDFTPLLSDYALEPVLNKEHAQNFMVAYKSPESSRNKGGLGHKTDVWSLGILILEALTGRFPANYLKQGRGAHADLASWVDAVVREEWTGEVFDAGMKETKDGEGEMLRLLKIGMCCCELDVEKRWDLGMVLSKIEELKERDSEEFDSSSYGTEGDLSSYNSSYNNHIHHHDNIDNGNKDHDNDDNDDGDDDKSNKGLTDHEDFTFSVQK
ncbi:probable LRR receptor-like serine/threonine-protein kinase At4g31250 [Impatiens glandulifera]|uniref:probable LRR receptor-like serine/threonine-protein kinase At4g31250 n=1 Tax=Impatiens glandulifera TaxID=253017 RepID=UPI001FB10B49|nr:probable LRR receptor-like serine/threonine-protein kinase At4g31250 [Impatiens glandulifera]